MTLLNLLGLLLDLLKQNLSIGIPSLSHFSFSFCCTKLLVSGYSIIISSIKNHLPKVSLF